jgi:hypothetical protein
VQIVLWNTANDTFTPGQWFHGRIYEKRCDLSPNGTRLIYFAQKINAQTIKDDKYTYAWTAISRPPYLTALALWPKGDCWDGGGLFLANEEVWLNHPPFQAKPHPEHRPQHLKVMHNQALFGEDRPILLRCLKRDGWHHLQEWQIEFIKSGFQQAFEERHQARLDVDMDWLLSQVNLDTRSGYVTHTPDVQERRIPGGKCELVMRSILVGFENIITYSVRDATGHETPLAGAEWADWDQRGRLVFARAGALFALPANALAQDEPRELVDLNGNKPYLMKAPVWATVW